MCDFFDVGDCFCGIDWAVRLQATNEALVAAELASSGSPEKEKLMEAGFLRASCDAEHTAEDAAATDVARESRESRLGAEDWIACDNADLESSSKNTCVGFLWYHTGCLPVGSCPPPEFRETAAWVCRWCERAPAVGYGPLPLLVSRAGL